MKRRRSKQNVEETRLKKELYSAILGLLFRLVGETVKDRLYRSVLVGLIGMAGIYFDLAPLDVESAITTPEQIIQSQSK